MRISDWSSDVCSSDLRGEVAPPRRTRPDHVVAAVLLAERGNVKRRRQARILDLPVEERLARAVREQLEQRPNLHQRPRCRQRNPPELRRLRIGGVNSPKPNRLPNRQRPVFPDENPPFFLLDRTERAHV